MKSGLCLSVMALAGALVLRESKSRPESKIRSEPERTEMRFLGKTKTAAEVTVLKEKIERLNSDMKSLKGAIDFHRMFATTFQRNSSASREKTYEYQRVKDAHGAAVQELKKLEEKVES